MDRKAGIFLIAWLIRIFSALLADTPSAMAIDFIMFLTTFPKIPSSVPYSEIALRRPLVRGFCRGLCRQRPVENSAQALAAASGVTAWRRPEFSSNR